MCEEQQRGHHHLQVQLRPRPARHAGHEGEHAERRGLDTRGHAEMVTTLQPEQCTCCAGHVVARNHLTRATASSETRDTGAAVSRAASTELMQWSAATLVSWSRSWPIGGRHGVT